MINNIIHKLWQCNKHITQKHLHMKQKKIGYTQWGKKKQLVVINVKNYHN